jgi:hypothetical protein
MEFHGTEVDGIPWTSSSSSFFLSLFCRLMKILQSTYNYQHDQLKPCV